MSSTTLQPALFGCVTTQALSSLSRTPNLTCATTEALPTLTRTPCLQGNCTEPPPEEVTRQPVGPPTDSQCVLSVATSLWRLAIGPGSPTDVWLDRIHIEYVDGGTPVELIRMDGEPGPSETHVWLTSVTLAANGLASGLYVEDVSLFAQGARQSAVCLEPLTLKTCHSTDKASEDAGLEVSGVSGFGMFLWSGVTAALDGCTFTDTEIVGNSRGALSLWNDCTATVQQTVFSGTTAGSDLSVFDATASLFIDEAAGDASVAAGSGTVQTIGAASASAAAFPMLDDARFMMLQQVWPRFVAARRHCRLSSAIPWHR